MTTAAPPPPAADATADPPVPRLSSVPPDFQPGIDAAAADLAAAPAADPGWNARTKALEVLAVLATAYTLFFARAILLPLTLALVLALLFRPVVRSLTKRLHINAYAGAAAVLIGTLVTLALALATLAIPAQDFAEGFGQKLDDATEKLRNEPLFQKYLVMQRKMQDSGDSDIFEVPPEAEATEEELDQESALAASVGGFDASAEMAESGGIKAKEGPDDENVATVVVEDRPPSLLNRVFSTAPDALGGTVLAFVFLYFLLAEGDAILNNVLGLLPSLHEKREAVELTRAAEKGVSRYLFAVALINAALGVCIGTAMWLVGLSNPILWGVMAMLLNYIPYVGAFLGAGIVFLAAYLEPEFSLAGAALAPLCYMVINLAEGNFVTPAILGKTIALNPLMVLLSLAFWGWIWGPTGAVLAVPLLSMAKIVCDQFERLQPVGRVLGP